MDISKSEFEIIYQDNHYLLMIDDKKLLTPHANPIKHSNEKILVNLRYELECIDKIDTAELSTYSLLSTQIDFIESKAFNLDKKTFRGLLLNDPTLSACAGPEKVYQFSKWSGVFEHLEIINIKYPDLIQAIELEETEIWISSMGKEYANSIDKLVDHFYRELNILSTAQKAAVICSINAHGSFIYGLLLSTKKCSEMEYSAAILASHAIIPNIFADVVKSEYRESFLSLKQEALLITSFVHLSLTPNIELSELIRTNVSNWGLLPEGARYPLAEAISKIHQANSDDYSSYVMLLGKSIEVTLKRLVFDEFKSRHGIEVQQQNELSIFLKQNEKVIQLAKFIAKEPHFIELGSMFVILEKFGGKTSRKNELLNSFFDFIIDSLKYDQIVTKNWINRAEILRHARNKAAHSDRFSLDEAKSVQAVAFELLKAF